MPSYAISRVGELEQDLIVEYDIALANDETLVAALRTNTSYLKVVDYRLASAGDITETGQAQTVQVATVSLTIPTANDWVTSATRIVGTKLFLSQWSPSVSHGQDGEGPATGGSVIASFGTRFTWIPPSTNPPPPPGTVVKSPQGYLVVTAHRNTLHELRVTAWISASHGIEELASAVSPERSTLVSIVANQTLPGNGVLESANVITASISSGKLRLATWRINVLPQTEATVVLVAETATDVAIKEISATVFSRQDGNYLATAVIGNDGKLTLITWRMLANGTFTRWLDAPAGAASGIDCVRIRRSDLAVGCRDGNDKLRVIYWRFPYRNAGSQAVIRMGTAIAGTLGSFGGVKLAHTAATSAKPGDTIAACRTEAGKLKLIRYRLTNGD